MNGELKTGRVIVLSPKQKDAAVLISFGCGTPAPALRALVGAPRTLDTLVRIGAVEVRCAGGRDPLYHLTAAGRAATFFDDHEGGLMPDGHDFDHLGSNVRCIHPGCGAGGPAGRWPAPVRERHLQESHGGVSLSRRPGTTNSLGGKNQNGGATMTKTSGKLACVAVLKAAGEPLTANEIATKVIESGIVEGLKGKTPKATLSAQITSGAKKGEVFKKVGESRPARFGLAADAPEVPDELLERLRAVPAIEDVTEAATKGGDLAEANPNPNPKPQPQTMRTGRGRSRAKQVASA